MLASESDPAVSDAFSESDYRTVAAVLERFYTIVLTDCGTGLLHSAMAGVLDLADQIVLVSSGRWTAPAAPARRWTGWRRTAAASWCATRWR